MAVPVVAAAGRKAAGTAGKRKAADVLGPQLERSQADRRAEIEARRVKRRAETAKTLASQTEQSGDESTPAPSRPTSKGSGDPHPRASAAGEATGRALARGITGNDGAGVILAFIAWVGIVMPAKNNGLDGVRNWWRAKFFNKGPDGNPL